VGDDPGIGEAIPDVVKKSAGYFWGCSQTIPGIGEAIPDVVKKSAGYFWGCSQTIFFVWTKKTG